MTLANSGHDENYGYSGGQAGDQTGLEWRIMNYYCYPWNEALEPPNEVIGADMALLATHGANNDNIGYDQSQRLTFYNQLMKAVNYDPANIKTKCEADCSSGVAALAIACGKRNGDKKMAAISPSCWTGNLGQALVNAGWKRHTDPKYLNSDKYLGKGWVLINTQNHTAINLTNGNMFVSSSTTSKPSSSTTNKPSTSTTTKPSTTTKKYSTGKYVVTAKDGLNVRNNAGTKYKIVSSTAKGATASVTETKKVGNDWWGKISNGWICLEQNGSAYVKKN